MDTSWWGSLEKCLIFPDGAHVIEVYDSVSFDVVHRINVNAGKHFNWPILFSPWLH